MTGPRVIAPWDIRDGRKSVLPPAQRVFRRCIVAANGCLIWPGPDNGNGYGVIYADYVHRVAYRATVGPIPDGFTIDHTCHNVDLTCSGGRTCLHRRCVNPAHLEAVTQWVNNTRVRDRRTHCSNGHAWDVENTRWNDRGYRECRGCHREREARRKQRIRDGLTPQPTVKPHQHGTGTGYSYGCRCDACREWCRATSAKNRVKYPHLYGSAARRAQRVDAA